MDGSYTNFGLKIVPYVRITSKQCSKTDEGRTVQILTPSGSFQLNKNKTDGRRMIRILYSMLQVEGSDHW